MVLDDQGTIPGSYVTGSNRHINGDCGLGGYCSSIRFSSGSMSEPRLVPAYQPDSHAEMANSNAVA